MTREELEKMFEEKVSSTRMYDEYKNEITDEVKDFIFETVILEVFKSILGSTCLSFSIDNGPIFKDINGDTIFIGTDIIKQKAKDKFNIII